MTYDIVPYVGAGNIRLGMTSNQVEAACNQKPTKFKKLFDDVFNTDEYDGFFVQYKSPGVCNSIQFFSPAVVTFHEKNLLSVPFKNAKAFLQQLDNDLVEENDSVISLKLGFGLYAPNSEDDPLLPPECVIVFERGYYDNTKSL